MPAEYKQSFLIVMESGKIIKWTGLAENKEHGQGLALAHAIERTNEQVWDVCSRPAH